MKAAYTPVAGSIADRAIKHLASLPAGTKMAVGELAPILGVKPENLGVNLHSAVLHKAIMRLRVGGGAQRARYAYSLPPRELAAATPAEAVEAAGQVDDSPEPEEDDDQGGQPVRRIVPAADTVAPRDAVASVFDLGAKVSHDGRLAVDVPPAAPPTSEKPAGLNWTPARPLVAALAPKPQDEARRDVKPQATAAAPAPALAPIAADLACALWNNGELWLKVTSSSQLLVLSRDQTRALVHYLDNLAHEPILEARHQ